MPLDAVLGGTSITVRDLAQLQVGDVVQLDTKYTEPVSVQVGHYSRFLAKRGRRGEQSAVQLLCTTKPE